MHIENLKTEAIAARKWFKANGYKFTTLTSAPHANPKLEKSLNAGLGVLSAPLHLAPADLSGYNVCPMATKGCKAACLHTAGNPIYMAKKETARIARTRAYFEARPQFMAMLAYEIYRLTLKAEKLGKHASVRLNATSDIPWEKVAFEIGGQRFANLMAMFPGVTFYDYTKRANRKNLPSNYSLTFSLAEDNDVDAIKALDNGMNVAAVFAVKPNKPLPEKMAIVRTRDSRYLEACGIPKGLNYTFKVIDGDTHDYRPADPRGVIVGLRAKGDARGDTSGFVRAA